MIAVDMSVFEPVAQGFKSLGLADSEQITSWFSGVDSAVSTCPPNFDDASLSFCRHSSLTHFDMTTFLPEPAKLQSFDVSALTASSSLTELHLKSADGLNIINSIISDLPDYAVSVAVDVTMGFIRDYAIDTPITNYVIEDILSSSMIDETVNPISPLSVLGWLIGLPF